MDDSDVRGIILQRAYDNRNRNEGSARISHIDFSGGEPVSPNQIMSAGRFLAESDFIHWRPLSTIAIADAQIKAAGVNAIEISGMLPPNIRLPQRAGIFGVEAKGAAGEIRGQPNTPPVLPHDDTANQVALEARSSSRSSAANQYGSIEPISVNGNIQAGVASASGAATASAVGEAVHKVTLRLAAQPVEASEAIRTLVAVISSQLVEMQAQKPNEPKKLEAHNRTIVYLEGVKDQLTLAADNLDKAIAEGGNTPEPFLTEEAAKIIAPIKNAFVEWLTDNRTAIADFAVSLTLYAAGYHFLKIVGIEGDISHAVSAALAASYQYARLKKKI